MPNTTPSAPEATAPIDRLTLGAGSARGQAGSGEATPSIIAWHYTFADEG